jgi:hypothetical protein
VSVKSASSPAATLPQVVFTQSPAEHHSGDSSCISFLEAFLARDILLVLRVLKGRSRTRRDTQHDLLPSRPRGRFHLARYTSAAPRARPASRVPCRRVRPPPRHRVEVPDLRCGTETASVRGAEPKPRQFADPQGHTA